MSALRQDLDRTESWPHCVLVIADLVETTQFISFLRPLTDLTRSGAVRLHFAQHEEGSALAALFDSLSPDLLVFSRYTHADARLLAARAREKNIPIVFHIDDDLLNVPMSLGAHKYAHYNRPDRLAALRANMNAADVVYASTTALAEAFIRDGIAAPIIAGDLYCSIDPSTLPLPIPATLPVLGYMGTGGHNEDLAMVLPVIVRLMDEMPGLRFETFDTVSMPKELMRFDGRIFQHAYMANYAEFMERLSLLGWWVGLAPLVDNAFNRCKADTKWVEYSYAGTAVVASDIPVYHRGCADGAGILCSEPHHWYDALRATLRDLDLRNQMVANARSRLVSDYSHHRLQQQILDVFSAAGRHAGAHRASAGTDQTRGRS